MFRRSYLNNSKGVLRQATTSDLPVGRSVDWALRLVQGFLPTVSCFPSIRGMNVLTCRSVDEG